MKQRPNAQTDEELRREVGRKIRYARQRSQRTAREVSERLEISREALTQIETGRNNVHAITLWKLATLLGCDISEFFPEIPPGFSLSKIDLRELAKEDEKAVEWAKQLFTKPK